MNFNQPVFPENTNRKYSQKKSFGIIIPHFLPFLVDSMTQKIFLQTRLYLPQTC